VDVGFDFLRYARTSKSWTKELLIFKKKFADANGMQVQSMSGAF